MSYLAAGGDPNKLSLLLQVGDVHAFALGASRCIAGIHPDQPTIGAVGDWVGGSAVREQAEDWLRSKGCTVARGPMELSSWFAYRANLGPHLEAPFLFEPSEGPERWLDAGYGRCSGYSSLLLPHEGILDAAKGPAARHESEGWSIRSLPRGSDGLVPPEAFSEAIDIIHDIAHEAFADAFGFTRLPLATMHAMYSGLRPLVDPDFVLFAYDPSGRPMGFVFAFPDTLVPQRRWLVIKTSAIRPSANGRRLGTWLNAVAHERARRKGLVAAVYALMWEGAGSQHWERFGAKPLRTYQLFERTL